MPTCSIKQCGARKSQNRPNLTHHRLPKNEVQRNQWLNAIGRQNINPRHRHVVVCSLHFEEALFNRTLDQVRLREDAVPTLSVPPKSSTSNSSFSQQTDPLKVLPSRKYSSSGEDQVTRPQMRSVLRTHNNVAEEQVAAASPESLVLSCETPPTSSTSDSGFSQKTDPLKVQPSSKYSSSGEDQVTRSPTSSTSESGFSQQTDPLRVRLVKKYSSLGEDQVTRPKMISILRTHVYIPEQQIAAPPTSFTSESSFSQKTDPLKVRPAQKNSSLGEDQVTRPRMRSILRTHDHDYVAAEQVAAASPESLVLSCETPPTPSTGNSGFSQKRDPLKVRPARKYWTFSEDQLAQVRTNMRRLLKLERVCEEQKKKMKRLHEKVRRQQKKIGKLENLLQDLIA